MSRVRLSTGTKSPKRLVTFSNLISGTASGSGLGLSVVAAIVRLHRFSLRFESAAPGLRVSVTCTPARD